MMSFAQMAKCVIAKLRSAACWNDMMSIRNAVPGN